MNFISRKKFLTMAGSAGLGMLSKPLAPFLKSQEEMLKRPIPSSGEELPVVGLGTWRQFDVGSSESERRPLHKVLELMAQKGGRMIDSSPMYGRAERVVGDLTSEMNDPGHFFYATKVWTRGRQAGISQMNSSMQNMQVETMDLMQIHNLVDWQTHLKTLQNWRADGKIRYIGITHYRDAVHSQLEEIIKAEDIDFVQFNYSIRNRHAEKNLLKTAEENGVATVINGPYEGGSLFQIVSGKDLPEWASEYDIKSWGQFFLKYILSHSAVNVVIPGTSDPEHLVDNMGAGYGPMPDTAARKKMVQLMEALY